MATPIPANDASFTLAEIAAAVSGRLIGPEDHRVRGVAIDSRSVQPSALFVAIRGAQHDGARFIDAAQKAGATALLLNAGTPCPDGVARIEVDDTTRALGDLATFHRRRWGRRVIAITGSAGKTTTKELTASAFSATGLRVHKTQGNLNNQFGVPMTLFGLTDAHDVAVLEVGTSARGEIARLGEITEPDVAAVLLAAAAHTAGIGSLSDIADEKASLWGALGSGGVRVVNRDDPELFARLPPGPCVSFGTHPDSDVRLVDARLNERGTALEIRVPGPETRRIELKLFGRAAAIDACAALACVIAACGREALDAALAGLSAVLSPPGRMNPRMLSSGVLLLDDSYNANPRSMQMSLETLKELASAPSTRSIAVLSDMLELGETSAAQHAQLGEFCVRLGIDMLVGCGPEMAQATISAARVSAGRLAPHPTRVAHVFDPLEAVRLLRGLLRKGDAVLVKGSRSMAMERVVQALCEGETEAP